MRNPSLTLNVTPRHSVLGFHSISATTHVCATLQARELPDDVQRAPVDIMVALDVSASMQGAKLALCKDTLEMLLRQLTANDSFGLVIFSNEAITEIPAAKVTASARQSALQKIKSLRERNSTNISAAIGLAAQELYAMQQHNEVQSIFLLTDGQANTGIVDETGLLELAKNCLAQPNRSPVPMHCFGYGSGHSDVLLRKLSSITPGGTYYFVENDSGVAAAFGDALGGILSTVAQNAVVDISIPAVAREAGVKILDVYHDNKIRINDWNFKVTIGDFYAEESRDVLYLVALSTSELTSPHVEVSVSYMDTIEKTLVVSQPCGCHIARPPTAEMSIANSHVEVQWLRVSTANDMERANALSRAGRMEEARQELTLAMKNLRIVEEEFASSDDPIIFQMKNDLEEAHRGVQSQSNFVLFGASHMSSTSYQHSTQRHMRGNASRSSAYRNSKQTAMSHKFAQG